MTWSFGIDDVEYMVIQHKRMSVTVVVIQHERLSVTVVGQQDSSGEGRVT
jgi:hypothetical protein